LLVGLVRGRRLDRRGLRLVRVARCRGSRLGPVAGRRRSAPFSGGGRRGAIVQNTGAVVCRRCGCTRRRDHVIFHGRSLLLRLLLLLVDKLWLGLAVFHLVVSWKL